MTKKNRRAQQGRWKDRKARLQMHKEKLEMLALLTAEYERRQDFDEVRRLKKRIRTIEQQVRYIGENYDAH